MRQAAERHAEEDRKRRELVEARNRADNMVYSSEKTLKDLGDKVPADLKQQVEDAAAKVNEVKDGEDLNAIKTTTDELAEVLQQLGSAAYQQEPQTEDAEADEEGEKTAEDGSSSDDEDVVDGEYKQV